MHRISEWKLTLFCIQKNPRSEGNLNPRKYIGIFSLLFKGDSFSIPALLKTVPIVFLLVVVVTDDGVALVFSML